MNYKAYIQELQNSFQPLELPQIFCWLRKYEKIYQKAVIKSNCRKWHKWSYKGEKPFPCVCPSGDEDCVFIETYYELAKLLTLHEHEKDFQQRKPADRDLEILEIIELLNLNI